MSRMLEALKQIEARSGQSGNRRQPPPPREPDSPRQQPAVGEEPVQSDVPPVPPQPVEDPAAGQLCVESAVEPASPEQARASEASATAVREVARLFERPPQQHTRHYRDLADNILSRLPADDGAVLLFTSPDDDRQDPGTLVALAAVLSDRLPGEVLVVDCDFRRGRLADHFGVHPDQGLADVLRGEASWQDVVFRTGTDGLSVLPGANSSAPDGRPPERLDPVPLLDELRRHYRLVLLDGASPAHAQTAAVARWCDGTYLVIRLGRTPRRGARQAIRDIQQGGGRVLGSVLVGV